MISFRKYLFEHDFKPHDQEFHLPYNQVKKIKAFSHEAQIGKHHVLVSFDPSPEEHQHGEYEVSFEVNGQHFRHMGDHVPSPEAGAHILRHVVKTTANFVNHVQPRKIHFYANEPEKEGPYHTFAKRLAKVTGATHTVEPSDYADADQHTLDYSDYHEHY